MRLVSTLFLLLLFNSPALAQQMHSRTYTLPPVPSGSVIHQLYQDNKGYIVVASSSGLYRFDGLNFQRYQQDKNVPDDVTAICETGDGHTWLGFSNGKLGLLQHNRIVLQDPEEGLPARSIKKIASDSAGVIWIATAGEGLYYFSGNRFYNVNTDDGLSDNYVYDLAVDGDGVYAGTDRGVSRVRLQSGNKQVRNFTSREGLPDNIIRALWPVTGERSATHSCFWIGMQDAGAGIYCPRTATVSAAPQWQFGQVNAVLQSGPFLYVASEDYGLVRFSVGRDNSLHHPEVFSQHKITALLQDREGNIWAAGGDKLIRTNGSKLARLFSLDEREAMGLHVMMLDKESHIWLNTAEGLKHLEPDGNGGWKQRSFRLPLSINAHITALHEDRFGNIWIGTMGNGAFIMDAATGRYRKLTEDRLLSSASVLSITGKDNDVWIASLEGAVHAVLREENADIGKTVSMQDLTAISGLGTNYIYHIFTDKSGRTWFATDGKGIAVYEKGKFTTYDQRHGLKSEVVYQVAEDDKGNIWFTTFNAGLVRFDGKNFRHFSTAEGLTEMNVTSMASDKNGNLFLSHRKGIDIVHTASGTISYLDEEQGISGVNTDLNTLTTNSNGDVFFVAGNGIYRYATTGSVLQPRVVIDRIQLFLSDVEVENGHVFASSENNISFYYTGLHYSQPGKVQYQYKLEGYGDEWITTNDRRKDFPRLGPGTYTFKVRASLNRNFENAPEASFRFTIAKPLWMRWWFIALALATIGLLMYLYVKGREKRLQKLERLEKEKIQSQFETLRNQVNPHFLFNSFNTLISEIEEDPHRAVEYVEHMADFFRNIVTYREKDVISLGEEISIIKDYLFIQRKRYGQAFQAHIGVTPAEEEQYYLAPLTLQLLAENAIKHNAAMKEKPLLLEIFVEADQLVVRNNINPRLHPEKSAGLGLQNIRRRYELLTKKTVVISNDDEYFTVIIPLIKQADATSTDHRR